MRFWWLRHGPTHEKAFVGWRDVAADLSDEARLDRLRAHLPEAGVVLASDLLRARQTADAITGARQRLPDAPGLREFDFGAWDGLGFAEVAERDPDLSRRFWDEPGTVAPPGGESWDQVSARVQAVVEGLSERDSDIITVAHIGVIMTQIARCAGETAASALACQIEPLSITRIDLDTNGLRLGMVNHCP